MYACEEAGMQHRCNEEGGWTIEVNWIVSWPASKRVRIGLPCTGSVTGMMRSMWCRRR